MGKRSVAACIGLAALLFVFGAPTPARSEVNVNVNIGPPPVVVAGPPEVIVIPHSMVYFAPDASAELLFFGGFWWTPHRGHWFRAVAYDGPWVLVEPRRVPVEIVRLPRDYRSVHVHGKRIPYGQLKKHHAARERDRRLGRGEWKGPKGGRGGPPKGNRR